MIEIKCINKNRKPKNVGKKNNKTIKTHVLIQDTIIESVER